jgi:hypothetical protein
MRAATATARTAASEPSSGTMIEEKPGMVIMPSLGVSDPTWEGCHEESVKAG